MTIGYITSAYGRASDTFIRAEVRELRALGHVVHTFSVRRPSAQEVVNEDVRQEQASTTYLLEAGFVRLLLAAAKRLVRSPRRLCRAVALALRAGPTGLKARILQFAYCFEGALLAEHLERRKVEHLHDHVGENSATVAMLASVLTGIPFSMTVHGPTIFNAVDRWALGEKVIRGAFTVCISSFTRSQCMMHAPPTAWQRLKVVRCGLSKALLERAVDPLPDVPRFVCVGRLCPEKGQVLLVHAAARLAEKGLQFRLRLVGDGPSRGQLESELAKLNLVHCVELLGWQDDARVREELGAARAMVLPSFAEGLPVALMEALALARPVITTAIAGIPELVQDGVNGWLVPAGDVEALAAAMEEALRTPLPRLIKMGLAGRTRVRAMHDGVAEARKLEVLFAESVERRRTTAENCEPNTAPTDTWREDEPAALAAGDSRCAG